MKATFYLLTIIFFSICFVACEKDNLDIAPNATFGGEIRDMETGELVEQEIIRGSLIIEIICIRKLQSHLNYRSGIAGWSQHSIPAPCVPWIL